LVGCQRKRFSDGEQTSLTLAIENLRRIVGATDLP